MTACLWPALVDGLVDVLTSELSGVVVFDGPPPATDATTLGVAVGLANPSTDEYAGVARQVWRDVGMVPDTARQETGEVRCTAWAWTGDDFAFRGLRSRVSGVLDDIHAALASISPVGLSQITDLRLMDSVDWVQTQDASGTTVEALFKVAYSAIVT